MRVVLDTNIIISRYLTPYGNVARIVDLWEQGAFELLVSDVILGDYARVLRYSRLRRGHQLVEIDDAFQEFTELVGPDETPDVVEDDPDDNHFLAATEEGNAECLVTGDPHLLTLGSYAEISRLQRTRIAGYAKIQEPATIHYRDFRVFRIMKVQNSNNSDVPPFGVSDVQTDECPGFHNFSLPKFQQRAFLRCHAALVYCTYTSRRLNDYYRRSIQGWGWQDDKCRPSRHLPPRAKADASGRR